MMERITSNSVARITQSKFFVGLFIFASIIALMNSQLFAQEKNLVQVKVFDQQMSPVGNVSVSINGKEFLPVQGKSSFHEIDADDLPPKSVQINKEELEAESWNYSKGILQIIVRKKNYKLFDVGVTNADGKPLADLPVVFNGRKKVTGVTNSAGFIEMPLALDDAPDAGKFSIEGYRMLRMSSANGKNILEVERLKQNQDGAVEKPSFVKNFSLDQIDSISSLTVFYAVFKNYEISKLDPEVRRRIDIKFNQLLNQRETTNNRAFISKISDSSFVNGDIKSLLEQAKFENKLLNDFRQDFDEKVRLINEKLSVGTENLEASDRESLLQDLNLLDDVLRQNEKKFYKNISDYRNVLSSLKASFFNIQDLENKLTASELRREEEKRAFRNQILTVVAIAAAFGILIIVLVLLRFKLKRQQKNLINANDEIKRVNDNLEKLVYERTRLLMDANKEMDILLYRSSHDLRAPLCSIIGLCNLAMHDIPSDGLLIEMISGTAVKMDKLLNKLRFMSEINQPSNYSCIYFSRTIASLKKRFEKTIIENGIEFTTDCNHDMKFYSYPHLVEIIMYNLIDNALFFSSVKRNNRPHVAVNAKIENDHLMLTILDNGIGISDAIKTKLWDMFFVGNELSRGNGLGLYIVSKSVHALDGKIHFESKLNEYTAFTVVIPVNTELTASMISPTPKVALLESA
jgi:signal transduction histidine kinase